MYSVGILRAMKLGIKAHEDTNHKYDKEFPYSLHLAHVVDAAYRFGKLVGLSDDEMDIVIAACWLHDCIEDARLTYNDVEKAVGGNVAEIVRAVTNYGRGRNRQERMPDFVYEDICKVPLARFVKISDRIANMEYSFSTSSGMFKKYAAEFDHFSDKLYDDQYQSMFVHMYHLIEKYELNLTLST